MRSGRGDWQSLRFGLYKQPMTQKASQIEDVLKALPAAQEAVRKEIQARILAGEEIASMDSAELLERSKAFMEAMRSNRRQKKSAA